MRWEWQKAGSRVSKSVLLICQRLVDEADELAARVLHSRAKEESGNNGSIDTRRLAVKSVSSSIALVHFSPGLNTISPFPGAAQTRRYPVKMVTTRRQAIQARLAASESPANLGNLPPELIHLIVRHLDRTQPIHCVDNTHEHACDPPPYNDDDCETVVSHDPAEADPVRGQDCTLTCCREGRTHMAGGEGWEKGEQVCVSDSLNLSAASRRLREVIFIDGKKRCRSIRLCDWWREETMRVSQTVRNRYK